MDINQKELIQQTILNYRILSLIGAGGMGSVYLATDLLQRKLAIKILDPILTKNPEYIQRFFREAKMLSSIDHTGIIKVYQFFEHEGSYYMVMEFAEGETLKNLIQRIGPINENRAILILKKISDALCFAHVNGITHRDIKPDNIIIDDKDNIKILDFGIAKLLNDYSLTRTGTKIGTVYYMSPEQIKGEKNIDSRTDIYSLGIVFYEMLTGINPHCIDAESDFEIMKNIVEGEIQDPRYKYPYISQNTVDLIKSMTLKNKNERMDSLVNALNNVLNDSETTKLENNRYNSPANNNHNTRILNKDIINELPKYTFCKHCGEEIELERKDYNIGKYHCPVCNKINIIDLSLMGNHILGLNKTITVDSNKSNYNKPLQSSTETKYLFLKKLKTQKNKYLFGSIILIAILFFVGIVLSTINMGNDTNQKKNVFKGFDIYILYTNGSVPANAYVDVINPRGVDMGWKQTDGEGYIFYNLSEEITGSYKIKAHPKDVDKISESGISYSGLINNAIVVYLDSNNTIPIKPFSGNIKPKNGLTQENENEMSLPPNGQVEYLSNRKAIVPFKIIAESQNNYFIKLIDYNSNELILTIFVREGMKVNTRIPIGSFYIKYAAGDKWYGNKYLFGSNTACYKSKKTITLNRNQEWTLKLYTKIVHWPFDYNDETESLSKSDF